MTILLKSKTMIGYWTLHLPDSTSGITASAQSAHCCPENSDGLSSRVAILVFYFFSGLTERDVILVDFRTHDEVIKKRLLIDGDAGNDEKRLTNFLRTFIKWCSSDETPDESHLTVQRMLATLAQKNQIEEAEKKILESKKELAEAKQIRKNRQEYDTMAKKIQEQPDRQGTTKKLEFVAEELASLEETKTKLDLKLDLRRKQFHVLISAIHELQILLEDTVGRYVCFILQILLEGMCASSSRYCWKVCVLHSPDSVGRYVCFILQIQLEGMCASSSRFSWKVCVLHTPDTVGRYVCFILQIQLEGMCASSSRYCWKVCVLHPPDTVGRYVCFILQILLEGMCASYSRYFWKVCVLHSPDSVGRYVCFILQILLEGMCASSSRYCWKVCVLHTPDTVGRYVCFILQILLEGMCASSSRYCWKILLEEDEELRTGSEERERSQRDDMDTT
ncbi:THOC7-like protein [Mya arenaria]|uniref:THOC7-like protein n=1 Tax=Mya arenaria TaxID=6604 RepID=A0ABY7FWE7_MYAAR|nr:THOC7-like protein [Mya arenaria]